MLQIYQKRILLLQNVLKNVGKHLVRMKNKKRIIGEILRKSRHYGSVRCSGVIIVAFHPTIKSQWKQIQARILFSTCFFNSIHIDAYVFQTVFMFHLKERCSSSCSCQDLSSKV